MLDQQAVGLAIRSVTPEECAFYRENGWAKLEGLLAPGLAAEMLAVNEPFEHPRFPQVYP
jgi:hypothetical protein